MKKTIKLKGQEYALVRTRVAEFRKDRPMWSIVSELVHLNEEAGSAVFRCQILDDTGRIIAQAYGSASSRQSERFLEKAETAAVGRALNLAGYGTELFLEDEPVDAPVNRTGRPGEFVTMKDADPESLAEATQPEPPRIPEDDPFHKELEVVTTKLDEQGLRALIEHGRMMSVLDMRYGQMRTPQEVIEYTYRKFWLEPLYAEGEPEEGQRPGADMIARVFLRRDRTSRLIAALKATRPPRITRELLSAAIGPMGGAS